MYVKICYIREISKLKEKPMFIDLLEVILGAASSQEDKHI
jgi:hypothetical protein